MKTEESVMKGDMETLIKAPFSMIVPLGFTYLASLGAKKVDVEDDFVSFGLMPESFSKIIDQRVMGNMKKIKHDFDDELKDTGIQAIIDENFFNMFIR
eukprot:NODE_957_length_1353_cov_34.382669_g796_i0.p3 GENE.NODE_957_length_1353_cov_34.382669_g796_i0~~NODE_957_length_1353_cov_34.382669_g796_i0.p3  ORF type:complete len:98 (-),score=38.39 NODE_957_length_1353_cov_34.382669_g796_i0:516-809(-)